MKGEEHYVGGWGGAGWASDVGDSAVVAAAIKILRRMYPHVGNPIDSTVSAKSNCSKGGRGGMIGMLGIGRISSAVD